MTPTPNPTDDERSPDERVVAARLSMLGGPSGPPPELDARILAAARAATTRASSAAATPPSPRRQRRWPAAIGVAASLVIAVGLAWQLGAVFELPPLLHHDVRVAAPAAANAPVSEDEMSADVLARANPIPRSAVSAPATGSAPPAAVAVPRLSPPARSATAARSPRVQAPVAAARPEPPREFVDEALANAKPAPPPPPQPAAAPAVTPVAAPVARAAESGAAAMYRPLAADARAEREPAADSAEPALDESKLGVIAWLKHIRSLRDGGRPDAARASLQRFIAAHPGMRIPRDLQPLAPPRD